MPPDSQVVDRQLIFESIFGIARALDRLGPVPHNCGLNQARTRICLAFSTGIQRIIRWLSLPVLEPT